MKKYLLGSRYSYISMIAYMLFGSVVSEVEYTVTNLLLTFGVAVLLVSLNDLGVAYSEK